MEDRTRAVDELVAGMRLEGKGLAVGCEVEFGAQVDLVPMSDEEQQQEPEREPADHRRREARAAKAHEVPAGAESDQHHEGRTAPRAEQAVNQPRAGEQQRPGPIGAGEAPPRAGHEQEHERGDGQVLEVPDVAAVGPHAAVRAAIGGREAADVGEHRGIGGKADQPETDGGARQPAPDVLGRLPRRAAATLRRRRAAEQNAQAHAARAEPVQNLDVDQVAIAEVAA